MKTIAVPVLAFLLGALNGEPAKNQFLFDMGTPDSPVERSHIRVTHSSLFDAAKGYGWQEAGESSFDRPKTSPPSNLGRDGVHGTSALTFSVAVPPGKYYVRVLVGDSESAKMTMSVYAGRKLLDKDMITRKTWWKGEPTSLLAAGTVEFTEDVLKIRVFGEENGCSVQGVQILKSRPVPFDPNRKLNAALGESLPKALKPFWDAFQSGQFTKALEEVRRNFPPRSDSVNAWLLTWIAGRVDYTTSPTEILKSSLSLLETTLLNNPADSGTRMRYLLNSDYVKALEYLGALGYSTAEKETGTGWGERRKLAENILSQIPEGDALYLAAQFQLGRIRYWIGEEENSPKSQKEAEKHFRRVEQVFPGFPLVRMYLGEEIPWGEAYRGANEKAPAWAVSEREALARLNDVIQYWIDERQRPNGELGGGWGDDVEMMRWWLPAAVATGNRKITRAMVRLANGVWNESGVISDGFFGGLAQVQYASELTSDSQPHLLALDLGNPAIFQRCLGVARLMKNLWSRPNGRGHRFFRSIEIGSHRVGSKVETALDVPYMAKAIQPAYWAAWYNHDPEVIKLFEEWGDAWLEACAKVTKGKPAGVPPAAIDPQTEEIGGAGRAWFNPKLNPSYFAFPRGLSYLFEHFIATYQLTGKKKYLQPIEACLDLLVQDDAGKLQKGGVGGKQWTARVLQNYRPLDDVWAKWRVVSEDSRFDAFLAKHGSPYLRWYLTGNADNLVEGFKQIEGSLGSNFELLTSEVRYTDRVRAVGLSHVMAMATGSPGVPGFLPAWKVTWETDTKHFAALVLRDSKAGKGPGAVPVHALIYNFDNRLIKVRMRVWSSPPGIYEFRKGRDENGDNRMDQAEEKQRVYIYGPGTPVDFHVQPDVLNEVTLVPVQELMLSEQRPDLAVSEEGMSVYPPRPAKGERFFVGARVLNIGSAPARNTVVRLYVETARGRILVRERKINKLPPSSMGADHGEMVWSEMVMSTAPRKFVAEVTIPEMRKGFEIAYGNNLAEMEVVPGKSSHKRFARYFQAGKLSDRLVPVWLELVHDFFGGRLSSRKRARMKKLRKELKLLAEASLGEEQKMANRLDLYVYHRVALGGAPTRLARVTEMKRVRELPSLGENRPDLALSPEDIVFIPPEPVKGEQVHVGIRVHNLGRGKTGVAKLRVYEGRVSEETLKYETIFSIPGASENLEPRVRWFWFDYQTFFMRADEVHLLAILSPEEGAGEVELNSDNNRAMRKLALGSRPNNAFTRALPFGKLGEAVLPVWFQVAQDYFAPRPTISQYRAREYQKLLEDEAKDAGPDEKTVIQRLQSYLSERSSTNQ